MTQFQAQNISILSSSTKLIGNFMTSSFPSAYYSFYYQQETNMYNNTWLKTDIVDGQACVVSITCGYSP